MTKCECTLTATTALIVFCCGAACVLDIDVRPPERAAPDCDGGEDACKCETYTPGLTPLALGSLNMSNFVTFSYEFGASTEENCPILFDRLVHVIIENRQQVYSFEYQRGAAGPNTDCGMTGPARGILDSAQVEALLEALAAVHLSGRSRECPPGVAIDPSTTREFEWDGALVIDQPCVCPRLDEDESGRLAGTLELLFEADP